MSTLHTVNRSPFERNTLDTCLSLCSPGSSLLLIEDAVIGALQNSTISEAILKAIKHGVHVYALSPDLKARGLHPARLIPQIALIDYTGFVKLSVENDRVQCWL